MQQQRAKLPALPMFVLAVRLYDLGQHDEALYWFYTAQYQARLFASLLDERKIGSIGSPAFEMRSAHGAFQQLAGTYLNGYAGCDQARWLGVLERVRQENAGQVPDIAALYPKVDFVPRSEWATRNTDNAQNMQELMEYIKNNWSKIQTAREQSGANKRFCK